MTESEITYHMGQLMVLVLTLSMLPVGIAALVGLLVGLFQGLTQIQDQTMSFALRLIAIALTLLASGRWMAHQLHEFTISMFDLIITSGTGGG